MKKLIPLCFILFLTNAAAQNKLFIPDTLAGPNYNLTMHMDSVQFFAGKISHTYAFNSNKYLGPTLLLNKGANVSITVKNQIDDTTTMHWHGLHVPAICDGGPHANIIPGKSWNPKFTVMDNAATYWYHPHPDMKTAQQAIKGAAGLIIVRDNVEAALLLPRKYGVDDFPVIVQCQQYDVNNQAMPKGMEDSTLLVNGTMNPYLDAPAQVVRMRLLNASGERAFNFGFSANKKFYQIASDGGLLDTPVFTKRVRLGPGERAEILVDLGGMNGQTIYLMGYGSELPMGVQGGPTMPMPQGSPPMDSPLNGIDFNILKINIIPPTSNPITAIPSALTTNTPYPESTAKTTRVIHFTADSALVMDGPFYFNGNSFDMMRIDYSIPLNSTEIWTLVNKTMVAHPFHIHDVQFYILDINGDPPSAQESGRKDVVLVAPGDSLRFITQFRDFADTIVPYMFHCHILMHEDDGMMGQFLVVPDSATGINKLMLNNNSVILYPNPGSETITIRSANIDLQHPAEIKMYDALGNCIYSGVHVESEIPLNVSPYSKGIYCVAIIQNQQRVFKKLVVE